MEGRISRESLTRETTRPYGEENRRQENKTPAAIYSRSRPYSQRRSSYRGARRGRRVTPEIIPEGMDLLFVQLLASGLLLLVVLFAAVIDSEGTNAVRNELREAFSNNTSASEFVDGATAVKEKLSDGATGVLEIFGGERSDNDANESIAELIEFTPAPPAEAVTDAVIDAETLKQINESSDENIKN